MSLQDTSHTACMILLDHQQWQKLNSMAVEIHAATSWDKLADLITGSLPSTLCADEAWWSEHGPEESLDGCSFQDDNSWTGPGHHLVTQFFITAESGVLLTVRNSLPFTDEQKYCLSLLREHLTIAARRHRSDPRAKAIHPPLEDSLFTRREKEILPGLIQGMTNPQIAHSLGISSRTVEKHVASILDKSGLDNRRMLIGFSNSSTPKNHTAKNG